MTRYNTEMEAPRRYAELKKDVTTLLEDTGRFLGRLVEAPKTGGGHQLLLDTKLSDFFAKYTDLKRRKEGGLSCAVLALTKSGMRRLNQSKFSISGPSLKTSAQLLVARKSKRGVPVFGLSERSVGDGVYNPFLCTTDGFFLIFFDICSIYLGTVSVQFFKLSFCQANRRQFLP